MPQIQTPERFNEDACLLLKLMGDRKFWEDETRFRATVRGFQTSYLATKLPTPEADNQVSTTYQMVFSQLLRRAHMLNKDELMLQ